MFSNHVAVCYAWYVLHISMQTWSCVPMKARGKAQGAAPSRAGKDCLLLHASNCCNGTCMTEHALVGCEMYSCGFPATLTQLVRVMVLRNAASFQLTELYG